MVSTLATIKARMDAGTASKEDKEYIAQIYKDIDKANLPASLHPNKKAWIAILLSLFPIVMGLGYIYLGRWKRFWITLTIQILTPSILNTMGLYDLNFIILIILWLFTIFEAYALTKK